MTTVAWTIDGAEALPIHANTHIPDAPTRAVALIVHGWTGCKDRNIVPVLAAHAASIGLIAHRFTFGHAGIEKDADHITRHDEFARDSLAFQFEDLRRVIDAIDNRTIPGRALPLILIGHSRGGSTVLGAAARAHREHWPITPAAVIAVAAPNAYTRFTEDKRAELAAKGFVEHQLARSDRGSIRMSRTWYAHHLDNPGRDLFAEDLADARGNILLIHGDADDAVPPSSADHILQALRANPRAHAELVRIPGGDHNLGAVGFGAEHRRAAAPAILEAQAAIERFLNRILPAPQAP